MAAAGAACVVRPGDRVDPESAWLHNHKRNVASQFGEDGIIQEVVAILGLDRGSDRWCIEIGAWDGYRFSNTWNLIVNGGWHGVLIEGDTKRFAELEKRYAGMARVTTVRAWVDVKGVHSLDRILLAATKLPGDIDLLSIDIDGADWHVWKRLEAYRPKIVVIEFNPSIPNDVHFVQAADCTVHQGSSLAALIALGKEKGYELVVTTTVNAVFVVADMFERFGIRDNRIDAMHTNGELESRLFQLYDGTLVLAGCKRLIWSKIDIDPERLQVLQPAERTFKGCP